MRNHSLRVALAPCEVPRDLSLLRTWLRRAHVVPWWGDPVGAMAAVTSHDPAAHALIIVDGKPIGYVCWQPLEPAEVAAAGLQDLPAGLIDIDILIGEPDSLGRGVGPRALSLVLARLRAEGVSSAGIACAVDNQRALRAYEKAGFHRFAMFREAGHDMCYLVQAVHTAV